MLPRLNSDKDYVMCSSGYLELDLDNRNSYPKTLVLVSDEASTKALFLCLLEADVVTGAQKCIIIKDFTEERG